MHGFFYRGTQGRCPGNRPSHWRNGAGTARSEGGIPINIPLGSKKLWPDEIGTLGLLEGTEWLRGGANKALRVWGRHLLGKKG